MSIDAIGNFQIVCKRRQGRSNNRKSHQLAYETKGVTQLRNTIIIICFYHEDKNIQLIDEHYIRLISSIHKDITKRKKLLQVNLFINDSIKSFSFEEKENVGWLSYPSGEYLFCNWLKTREKESDFLVSCIILLLIQRKQTFIGHHLLT